MKNLKFPTNEVDEIFADNYDIYGEGEDVDMEEEDYDDDE